MVHSDDYSNIQRLPQSSAHFLSSPNETLRFTPLLCVFPQTVLISKQRWTAAFRLYRPLPIRAQRRPFCFPHVFLYITVTSVSRAFYFGLELIFLFVFRSVVKLAALLLLCLISVCIYHFKCCRYLDLMIVFFPVYWFFIKRLGRWFFKMYYRWKKWKDEPLDQWFRWHLFVYLSLASSILILFLSLYCIYAFLRNWKKVTSLRIDTSEGLLLKTGPKSADQKREMEVNVALSLALKRGAVEWV